MECYCLVTLIDLLTHRAGLSASAEYYCCEDLREPHVSQETAGLYIEIGSQLLQSNHNVFISFVCHWKTSQYMLADQQTENNSF